MRIIGQSYPLLVAAMLAATGASAAPRDQFVGEWGGDCGSAVQCWLAIAKAGKAYRVDFVVADRMDINKVRCKVAASMTRGAVRYGPRESYPVGLSGQLSGSNAYVAPVSGGSLILGGGLTAGQACGRYTMQQIYYPIGD